VAFRSARQAKSGAELHHCLIKIAGARPLQELLRVPQNLRGVKLPANDSLKNALDIPIHYRDGLRECDARNSGSGIASDSGQVE
jgi:hypothetical protein